MLRANERHFVTYITFNQSVNQLMFLSGLSSNKYECTWIRNCAVAYAAASARRYGGRHLESIMPYQSMHIYLKNSPPKSHPDTICNNRA